MWERVLRAPAVALRAVTGARADDARAVWAHGGHVHIAVRGVARTDELARTLAARVGALPGVDWAGLDAGAGRLVAACAADAVDAVVAEVAAVEAELGATGPFPALVDDHPADGLAAARPARRGAAARRGRSGRSGWRSPGQRRLSARWRRCSCRRCCGGSGLLRRTRSRSRGTSRS